MKYDSERGEGAKAAAKYGVANYPTLLVLDENGNVLVRQLGLESEKVTAWLTAQTMARSSEAELQAQVKAHPDDVTALGLLAGRAEARGDRAAARGWLARLETNPDRDAAADAGWRRIESELDEQQRAQVRKVTLDYLQKYPAHGEKALKALAAAGADTATLDRELARVVDATGKDDLNGLVYLGLSIGAFDGALAAADKQVKLDPDNPNAYDSLAEVWNYRGDKAKALATERKGMETGTASPSLRAAMEANLARFEKGGPTGDVPARPTLSSPLSPPPGRGTPQATPESAARRLYSENASLIRSKCGKQKAKLDEAYVRVAVGDGKLSRVEVLEPSASPALRRCLEKAVREVAVPAEQQPARVTLAIPL